MKDTEKTFHTCKASINFAAGGPAAAWKLPFRFPSHHPHTWVLFAALASISILLQHCLEHGKMVGIVSVGSLRGGGTQQKSLSLTDTVTHKTPRHWCSRVEVIHWHQTVPFYSGNSAAFTAPHWTNKKMCRWKGTAEKSDAYFRISCCLAGTCLGFFPQHSQSRRSSVVGCMERMLRWVNRRTSCSFMSLIKVLNSAFIWLFSC